MLALWFPLEVTVICRSKLVHINLIKLYFWCLEYAKSLLNIPWYLQIKD